MSSKNHSSLAAVILGCSVLVGTAAFAAENSSSYQVKPSDAQISQQVMQKLEREMPDSLVGLQVQTRDGVVTLSGRADTGLAKQEAWEIARHVPGVMDVKDHLQLQM